jgi:hypothetical protein
MKRENGAIVAADQAGTGFFGKAKYLALHRFWPHGSSINKGFAGNLDLHVVGRDYETDGAADQGLIP